MFAEGILIAPQFRRGARDDGAADAESADG